MSSNDNVSVDNNEQIETLLHFEEDERVEESIELQPILPSNIDDEQRPSSPTKLPMFTLDLPENDDIEHPTHNYDKLNEVLDEFEEMCKQRTQIIEPMEDDENKDKDEEIVPECKTKTVQFVEEEKQKQEKQKQEEDRQSEDALQQSDNAPDIFDILNQSMPKSKPTRLNQLRQWWNRYFC